jgi:hypothetical protein
MKEGKPAPASESTSVLTPRLRRQTPLSKALPITTTPTITLINHLERELGQGIVGCLDEQPGSKTDTSSNGHTGHLGGSSLGGSRRGSRRGGRGSALSGRGGSRGSALSGRRDLGSQGVANAVSIKDAVERKKQTYVAEAATELADSRTELMADAASEASEARDEAMLEAREEAALAALPVAEAAAPPA